MARLWNAGVCCRWAVAAAAGVVKRRSAPAFTLPHEKTQKHFDCVDSDGFGGYGFDSEGLVNCLCDLLTVCGQTDA